MVVGKNNGGEKEEEQPEDILSSFSRIKHNNE